MLDPEMLCRKHLLGEHTECHTALACIYSTKPGARRWLENLIRAGYLELDRLQVRHDLLAAEMVRRGYQHDSPLVAPTVIDLPVGPGVDLDVSLDELCKRCVDCRLRHEALIYGATL